VQSLLLTYLSLPLLDLEQMPQLLQQNSNYINGVTPRAFNLGFKTLNYLRANPYDIISNYVLSEEFDLNVPSPKGV
jgi:hypothetical protein